MPIFTEPTTLPTTYAGVLLSIDLPAPAVAVTVTRTNPDGSQHVVRSGNRAPLVEGYVAVYDAEAPLGVLVTYTATPHNADGTDGEDVDLGSAMTEVARRDAWLKSVTNPSLSRIVLVSHVGWHEQTHAIRQAVMQVIGSPSPVVEQDVELLPSGTLGLIVEGKAALDDVEALLNSGVLLLEGGPGHVVIDDVYLVRGDRKRTTHAPDLFELTVAVQQVDRPTTVNAPLRIPGRSSADWLATGITNEAAELMGWSFRQALENDPGAMPAGDADSATGGAFGTGTFGTSSFGGV